MSNPLEQAEAFLNSRVNLERLVTGRRDRMDLGPIRSLLRLLDEPQSCFSSIHVAGTLGKGSVSHYLSSLLRALGFRVGLYTSPHFERVTERIRIDGREIEAGQFSDLMHALAPAAEKENSTYFDVLTAAAFVHFAAEGVEWAVVETGLGGRLDSTNVVKSSLCVLTELASDHADVLGNREEARAEEKAGIIKNTAPVVCGFHGETARSVVAARCREKAAPLHLVERDFSVEGEKIGPAGISFWMRSPGADYPRWELPTTAWFQAANFACAAKGIEILFGGVKVQESYAMASKDGVLSIPGRMESFPGNPQFIVDGGHMPEAVRAVLDSLEPRPPGPVVALFGSSADKDFRGMLRELGGWADTLFVTSVSNNPRAVSPRDLKAAAHEMGIQAHPVEGVPAAVQLVSQHAARGTVLVIGSIYLAGKVRELLRGR